MKPNFIICSLIALSMLAGFSAHAQTTATAASSSYQLPEGIVLNTKEDYAKYEKDVIAAAKWLEDTDLDKEKEKRAVINDFVTKWLLGSPNVSVAITPSITALFSNNPALLSIFMASYTRNILETGADATPFNATKAALTSVITVYSKGITINKDKSLEKMKGLTTDSQMETYMTEKLNIAKN